MWKKMHFSKQPRDTKRRRKLIISRVFLQQGQRGGRAVYMAKNSRKTSWGAAKRSGWHFGKWGMRRPQEPGLPIPRAGIWGVLVGAHCHQVIPQVWLCQGQSHNSTADATGRPRRGGRSGEEALPCLPRLSGQGPTRRGGRETGSEETSSDSQGEGRAAQEGNPTTPT